jgi:hypothetical protein
MKERYLQAIGAILILTPALLHAQQPLTWQEVQDRFHAANRSLQAGQIGVDESRASETTAYLRPNPTLNVLNDQINPFSGGRHTVRLVPFYRLQASVICTNGSANAN